MELAASRAFLRAAVRRDRDKEAHVQVISPSHNGLTIRHSFGPQRYMYSALCLNTPFVVAAQAMSLRQPRQLS